MGGFPVVVDTSPPSTKPKDEVKEPIKTPTGSFQDVVVGKPEKQQTMQNEGMLHETLMPLQSNAQRSLLPTQLTSLSAHQCEIDGLKGIYIGDKFKGIANGLGYFELTNGSIWKGNFKNGKTDGIITKTEKDGTQRQYECEQGQVHGFHFRRYANGDAESSYYWRGNIHGLIHYKHKNGKDGWFLWEKNQLRCEFSASEAL